MATDQDRAAEAFGYLFDDDPTLRASSQAMLEMLPETVIREVCRSSGRMVPRWLEIHWAAPRIAAELAKGRRITVIVPTSRSPLAWSIETPRASRQE